jgi:vacuolar-type H+-ATPase subunit I/STV1
MNKYIFSVIKIITNLATISVFFIKFFHSIAVLPVYDEFGEFITTYKNDHYYNPLDNLITLDLSILMYISISITVASIVLTIFRIVKRNSKKLKIVNNFIYILSISFFLVVLLLSATVSRKY